MITISVIDSGVLDAFNRLIAFGESPRGALESIGETVMKFTKERFVLSVDPYGNPWAPNSDVTLRAALNRMQNTTGKIFHKRKGTLNKPGLEYLAGKKPLIGETKNLSTQFTYRIIGDNSVTISCTDVTQDYAATQNFGAKQGAFGRDKRNHPIPWGDIPARPFFPNSEQGLPDELSRDIMNVLRESLQNAMGG